MYAAYIYDLSMKDDQLANVFGAMVLALATEMEGVIVDSRLQSGSHCAAIAVIVQQSGLSIDQLRRVLGMSHSGTVRIVDRLVDAGLAVREAGLDGRTVKLSATRAGRREFEAISERRLGSLRAALKALDREEREQLGVISAKLLGGFASTVIEAQHVCRLCEHSVCVRRGGCPVAESVAGE